jgi:hypothetical protein
MYRKKPDVDVVSDVLKAALAAYPESEFIKSLSFQYEERGGLSKKQLEGLFKKAQKVKTIPASRLATLEAEILKRPTRFKSPPPPPPRPMYTKDERTGEVIDAILSRYPQHKRVLFFKSKYDNNEILSPVELSELDKFNKLLQQKG